MEGSEIVKNNALSFDNAKITSVNHYNKETRILPVRTQNPTNHTWQVVMEDLLPSHTRISKKSEQLFHALLIKHSSQMPKDNYNSRN